MNAEQLIRLVRQLTGQLVDAQWRSVASRDMGSREAYSAEEALLRRELDDAEEALASVSPDGWSAVDRAFEGE